MLAIAGFAGAVALGLLRDRPVRDGRRCSATGYDYGRGGLALVALGMGFHLVGGHAEPGGARARPGRARRRRRGSLAAALFVGWMFTPIVDDQLVRAEVGYFGAAALLSVALAVLYRRADARVASQPATPPRATGSAPAA